MRGSTGISHRHSVMLVLYSSFTGCGLQHHERTGTSNAQRVHTKGVPVTDATNTQSAHKRPSITIRRQPKNNAPAAALSYRAPGCAPNPGNKHVTSHTAPRPAASRAHDAGPVPQPGPYDYSGRRRNVKHNMEAAARERPTTAPHTYTHKLWQPPSSHGCTPTSATAAQAAEMCWRAPAA